MRVLGGLMFVGVGSEGELMVMVEGAARWRWL